MALVLDTGIIYAYYDRSDDWHSRAKEIIVSAGRGLIVPSPVIPEVDHLLRHRLGAAACHVFMEGLSGGSYIVADVPRDSYARIAALNQQYADLGFVDASVIVIAEVKRIRRIATTDRRHFAPLAKPLSLELVP